MRDVILVRTKKEVDQLISFLSNVYPEDEDYIEFNIGNNKHHLPIYIYVYKNKEDGFGNRTEYDRANTLNEQPHMPVKAYVNRDLYPEYWL